MKHGSKAKRNKGYRPRLPQIPVMPDLQREFMFASHGALTAMRLHPNIDAFDQLAALFNVVYVALRQSGRSNAVLESGMRALAEVEERHQKHQVLEIRRFELPPIENAVIQCESLVKELDVLGLHLASLKTRALARLSMAFAPLEQA